MSVLQKQEIRYEIPLLIFLSVFLYYSYHSPIYNAVEDLPLLCAASVQINTGRFDTFMT